MQPETGSDGVNYKKKYKALKRKLRMLIYEQECFAEELRKAQRKLLRISRDKSFLLDRLLQYEQYEFSGSDSDATADTDSEPEPTTKRKKTVTSSAADVPPPSSLLAAMTQPTMKPPAAIPPVAVNTSGSEASGKAKPKISRKPVKTGSKVAGHQVSGSAHVVITSPTRTAHPTHAESWMSREELERHLELKQSTKSQFMNIENTPMLPDNIFNDNSNS